MLQKVDDVQGATKVSIMSNLRLQFFSHPGARHLMRNYIRMGYFSGIGINLL